MTMLDKCARAIHDTDDMCDTVWPDSDDDTGYRGGGGYVRLCQEPELYRQAARAVLKALRDPTPEMVAAIWAKIGDAKKAAGIARLGPGPGVRDVINAYIDEALKERT